MFSAEQIIAEYKKNKAFYSRGGITVTGGEPLLQMDFLIELFTLAKQSDIHTAIDTSGVTYSEKNTEYLEKLDRLMEVCDLVMLDIKHIDSKRHKALTGKENKSILAFAKYLDKKGVPIWIRHVVIAGYTDSESDLFALGEFIGGLKHLKALDVLPYHTLGKGKYASLGMKYPLEDVPPTSKEAAERAKATILSGIMAARKKK